MEQSINYIPILIMMVFASVVSFVLISIDYFFGQKRSDKQESGKCEPGVITGKCDDSFADHLYTNFMPAAMIFILFDAATLFIYPWAVSFKSFGFEGFFEMLSFASILLFGLYYAAKKGSFELD